MLTRAHMRNAAAGVSAVIAVLYFLIALGVLTVVTTAPKAGDWVIPAAAGVAFAILAVFLVESRTRTAPIVGIALALFTILGYFAVAPNRTPSFELWGIVIKVAQGTLAIALAFVAMRPAGIAMRSGE